MLKFIKKKNIFLYKILFFLSLWNNVSEIDCAETSRLFGASGWEFSRIFQEEAKRSSVRGKHHIALPGDPCITFIARLSEFSVHGVVSKRICNRAPCASPQESQG